MDDQQPWHHFVGLTWEDFFHGTSVRVELEKDLSLKHQLLDLVIIRPEGAVITRPLPDGFEELAPHNLVTFKSYRESLDGWTLIELLSYYANYRKQVSPSMRELMPETDIRLFAVCARSPQNLTAQIAWRQVKPGVYEMPHYTGVIRVVAIHELPKEPQNAALHLFAAKQDLIEYAAQEFQPYSDETSTLLARLVARYRGEGVPMPENLKQFVKRARQEMKAELKAELLAEATPEERLATLTVEQRLQG